ncbi:cytochrome c553 [Rhodoblastus acidophilus]|uniref:c-type cytochrome n=1 Tax=Rhodoblastus acidophilus TaxID=1074 RepID=UPI0022249533|nr:cytochrome c [Rhodoblastus acidophilus]MCW2283272.1 cytochrome c553 [Rhodoblastus acidophilus]MCW2332132.1 cytochrome c553 [Rhodoblastus acidophilus]
MGVFGRGSLSLAASFIVLFGVGAVRAENGKPAAVSPQAVQAKTAFCKTCHGQSGQGFLGVEAIPRLAGQQPEYIAYELTALKEHRRIDPFMSGVAGGLSPEMIQALSTQFKDFNPPPASPGPQALVAEGKKIYEEGVPSAEVPPCSACHGEDAKGAGEFPRLAGQLQEYMVRELEEWDAIRGLDAKNPDNAAIMSPITHKLTKDQKNAVAAYLSNLK